MVVTERWEARRTAGRTDTMNKNDRLLLIFYDGGSRGRGQLDNNTWSRLEETTRCGRFAVSDALAASRCQLLMLVVGGVVQPRRQQVRHYNPH